MAVSRKKVGESLEQEGSNEEEMVMEKKTSRTSKRAPARTRKKVIADSPEDEVVSVVDNVVIGEDVNKPVASGGDLKKKRRKTQSKGTVLSGFRLCLVKHKVCSMLFPCKFFA